MQNGLSDNFVFSIQQDRQGRLWFATSAGVSRYDGVGIQDFTMSGRPGQQRGAGDLRRPSGSSVVLHDRRNQLSGEERRLRSMRKPVFKNYTKRDGLPHDSIEWVLEDKVGNFWIGTRGGGLSYFDGRTFQNYGEAHGLTAKTIWVLRFDRQGKLWIGSSEGLHSFDGKTSGTTRLVMDCQMVGRLQFACRQPRQALGRYPKRIGLV